LQGHRRAGLGLPRQAVVGGMALTLARNQLPAPARGRTHRLGRGDNRGGLRCRGAAPDHWPAYRPLGGRDLVGVRSALPGGVPAADSGVGPVGANPQHLAREFEPNAQSIVHWVRQADRDAGASKGRRAAGNARRRLSRASCGWSPPRCARAPPPASLRRASPA
jgi:hypothetical protein